MHGMKRHAESLLTELLTHFPCVAIVGVRQCGKTTLLGKLAKEWRILDMEKSSDLEMAAHDPDLFLRLHPRFVALDEAQRLPSLFPALRVAIDADRHAAGRFVLTGSSSPEIVRSISETLAGRVAVIELSPFSPAEAYDLPPSAFFAEMAGGAPAPTRLLDLPVRMNPREIFDYWLRGGYPEPWLKKSDRFSRLWTENYLKTYFERDIRQLFPSLAQDKYRLFLHMLCGLSGTIINYSEIARALGVSQPTARDYLGIAHGTFVWRHLPAFSASSGKRIVKHPKGYLRDSGLLHALLHVVDEGALLSHPRAGASWEGMVIDTLLRGLDAAGVGYEAFHYRSGGGAEVDLVLRGNFGLLPVEIKRTQTVASRGLRPLRDFMADHGCRLGLVIGNDERPRMLDENIVGVPLGCL